MRAKVWIAIGAEAVLFALLLFGSAGTLRWPAGWAFLLLFFGCAVQMARTMARQSPALLEERLKPPIRKGQPLWDKIVLSTIAVLFFGWLMLMGLDAVRFRWSSVPVWLQVIGAGGMVLGMWAGGRIFQENTFASSVVRIQTERAHAVISTGPYAIVRHPLYATVLIYFPSIALMLGSWWGVAGGLVLIAGVVLRTALEDRELQRGLAGYKEYAARVRYRLIPNIW